jgi:hypothetical protein
MKAFPNMTGQQGMDLRDYFAAQAMQALIIKNGAGDLIWSAKYAYEAADALMKVRGDSK